MADKADRRPHQLSGGERQRVGIARALVGRPSLLLVDEPTAALDRARSHEVVQLLAQETRQRPVATVMVTHDHDVLEHCDSVYEMIDGSSPRAADRDGGAKRTGSDRRGGWHAEDHRTHRGRAPRRRQRAASSTPPRPCSRRTPGQTPCLAAVAPRAGLARSCVYEYFRPSTTCSSRSSVKLPRWSAVVESDGRGPHPRREVLAYVGANLQLVARGDHALARAMATVGNSEVLATSSRLLHDSLEAPLRAALAEHGASDPNRMAEVVQSIVYALSRMIEGGLDLPRPPASPASCSRRTCARPLPDPRHRRHVPPGRLAASVPPNRTVPTRPPNDRGGPPAGSRAAALSSPSGRPNDRATNRRTLPACVPPSGTAGQRQCGR